MTCQDCEHLREKYKDMVGERDHFIRSYLEAVALLNEANDDRERLYRLLKPEVEVEPT